MWIVGAWSGEPRGLDGQALRWVEPARLPDEDILEADGPISRRSHSGTADGGSSVPRRRTVVGVAHHDRQLLAGMARCSLTHAPRSTSLQRSLQNGRNGEAADHSTGRWQVGQVTVFTLRYRSSA